MGSLALALRHCFFASCMLATGTGAAFAQPGTSLRAFLAQKPEQTILTSDHSPYELEVKFIHESGVRLNNGLLTSSTHPDAIKTIQKYLRERGADIRPLLDQPVAWLDEMRERGERRSGIKLHDLNLFYRVEVPAPESDWVCDFLNSFEVVEIAYPSGRVSDPSTENLLGSSTPDFEAQQGYLDPAPLGVDADFGHTCSGGRGAGMTIADVETGWTIDHEDFDGKLTNSIIGLTPPPDPWNHGTAVVGELIGQQNGFGVVGICPDSDVLLSSHLGSFSNVPTAIMTAANAVGPGDAVVIEVQCFDGPPSPHPCEYAPGIFATVQTATANGIHVFAAAGNGFNDLDQAAYGGAFDRSVRDSGAVMVAASDGSTLNHASFTNYGSRIDVHGWGFDVTTCGYGDLQTGAATEQYTAAFSGTSSATPIVTGAGVLIEMIQRKAYGTPLDPLALRDLLTNTGTPGTDPITIGPRPDVKAALRFLEVPEIEVTGTFVPDGPIAITQRGTAGDFYGLMLSADLRATPLDFPKYGELFLDGTFSFIFTGMLGVDGTSTLNGLLPPDVGDYSLYMQTLQVFQTKPGRGSFSNYFAVDVGS